jgi:hypothetical protein
MLDFGVVKIDTTSFFPILSKSFGRLVFVGLSHNQNTPVEMVDGTMLGPVHRRVPAVLLVGFCKYRTRYQNHDEHGYHGSPTRFQHPAAGNIIVRRWVADSGRCYQKCYYAMSPFWQGRK